jgi:hypothetical protein
MNLNNITIAELTQAQELHKKLMEHSFDVRSFLVSSMEEDLKNICQNQFNLLEHQKVPEGDWKYWLCIGSRASGKTTGGIHAIKEFVLNRNVKDILVLFYNENTSPQLYNIFENWCKPKIVNSNFYDEIFLFDNGANINFLDIKNITTTSIHPLIQELLWADEPTCLENPDLIFKNIQANKYIFTFSSVYNFDKKFEKLLDDAGTIITRGLMADNKQNLSSAVFNSLADSGVV